MCRPAVHPLQSRRPTWYNSGVGNIFGIVAFAGLWLFLGVFFVYLFRWLLRRSRALGREVDRDHGL